MSAQLAEVFVQEWEQSVSVSCGEEVIPVECWLDRWRSSTQTSSSSRRAMQRINSFSERCRHLLKRFLCNLCVSQSLCVRSGCYHRAIAQLREKLFNVTASTSSAVTTTPHTNHFAPANDDDCLIPLSGRGPSRVSRQRASQS